MKILGDEPFFGIKSLCKNVWNTWNWWRDGICTIIYWKSTVSNSNCVKGSSPCHLITIHGALYLTPVRREELYIWFDPHNLRTTLLPPFLNLTFNTRDGFCYGPQNDQSSQITQIRQKWTLKYIKKSDTIHSQKWWVLCSFAYLRWRRRDVCNFHMI
jgi:hypothetical protein